MDAEKRLLKIKTGSVVRLKKELGLYEKEKETEAQRVVRMKEQGADVYDIKHAVGSDFSDRIAVLLVHLRVQAL